MTLPSNLAVKSYPTPNKSNARSQEHQGWRTANLPTIQGLYLHIPFCLHKCHYCDFYSIVESPQIHKNSQQQLAQRIAEELAWRQEELTLTPRTIFAGGGTPTLLSVRAWTHLLDHMSQAGILAQLEEFTVEANPETVSPQLLDLLVDAGVNRISIGAQSFHQSLLKILERQHAPVRVHHAVDAARRAGINNINLDLIFAIPGQDLPMLKSDLDTALALEPDHLSVYALTYEPHTPMTARLKQGRFTPVPEQLECEMYALVMERLDAAGFEHYEISNWARRIDGTDKARVAGIIGASTGPTPISRQCQHNLIYWRNENWLGVGPAAASHINGYRWKNQPHLGRYLAQRPEPPTIDHEHLPRAKWLGEQLMLRLRLRQGARLDWLGRCLPRDDPRHQAIDHLIDLGMLERTPTHLRLTRRGLFVADTVIGQLLV